MVLNSLVTGTVGNAQIKPEYYSPVREEHPSTHQRVSLTPSHFFKPLQQGVIDPPRAKLDDKLIVVNRGLLAILGHGALHVPRCDDLLMSSRL